MILSPSASRRTTCGTMNQAEAGTTDTKVVVCDHSFKDGRAWFRLAFNWSDTKSGEARSRAGMQSYRIEGGKLAETWLRVRDLEGSIREFPFFVSINLA
jgi:hypothetical protein